jgi:glycosyltransferase involved in cell wall biosynthesis
MKVAVLSETRFCRTGDGSVWANASPYEFWTRYLDEFDEVAIVGREERVAEPGPGMVRVDGPRVRLRRVPHYAGARDLVFRWPAVRTAVRPLAWEHNALILRLGSILALGIERSLLKSRRPYGVEVVGDPWNTFAPGVVDVPMRSVIRRVLTRSQQRLCAAAAGAAYVTERTLQQRYPCGRSPRGVSNGERPDPPPFTAHYSSIELSCSEIASRPRRWAPGAVPCLITVGSLAQRYKGIDVLIRALRELSDRGRRCQLVVIGEGRYRAELQQLANDLRVETHFTSQLERAALIARLDRADLFVLASRTEGLPRALLEAMARGLPCVATRVGGIPELLDEAVLCDGGSVTQLVERVGAVLDGAVDANEQAARNLARVGDFSSDVLRGRRRDFYRRVRLVTELWRGRVAA